LFLIDGTIIAKWMKSLRRLGATASAVVFIDDADVIFEGEDGDRGLYRYLLTKLDGSEGAGVGRVCVMMTAMQPSSLPAAILRSGRIEVWLETRLPDEGARSEILRTSLVGAGTFGVCEYRIASAIDSRSDRRRFEGRCGGREASVCT